MQDGPKQDNSNKIAGAAQLFFITILAAILVLQLMVALKLEFIQSLTDFAMRLGFTMWVVFYGAYIRLRVLGVLTTEVPQWLYLAGVVCLILSMVSLAGMFAPDVKTLALWVNVLIAPIFLAVLIADSLSTPVAK